jgi:hypothetical protein
MQVVDEAEDRRAIEAQRQAVQQVAYCLLKLICVSCALKEALT